MGSFDRPHAGIRANAVRRADGRFERLQRHRENIRRIARELNLDLSQAPQGSPGLARGQRENPTVAGMRPPALPVDETSRPSSLKEMGLAETPPEVGEDIFDALRHYQTPKAAPEEVPVTMPEASGARTQGSPRDEPPPSVGVATPTQTLTHTGSSVLADALPPGVGVASAASVEVEPALECHSCGHAASAGQRFCQHCGQRLEAHAKPASPSLHRGASGVQPPEVEEETPPMVDEAFDSILGRWRQQFADFQRAFGDTQGVDTAETAVPTVDDGDPEAFVQRIKQELGIDVGPLSIEPTSTSAKPAEVELPFSATDVLNQIQAMSASFEAQAEAFIQDQAVPEAEAPQEPLVEVVEADHQTADAAAPGSPKSLAEEALLSRLVALEAEVLKLRGESAEPRSLPELSESPRRPAEKAERFEVEAPQAMSSLGMSLISSSSLFASVSDPGHEASPEHWDEEQKESEALPTEPKTVRVPVPSQEAAKAAPSEVRRDALDPATREVAPEMQKAEPEHLEEPEKVQRGEKVEKSKEKATGPLDSVDPTMDAVEAKDLDLGSSRPSAQTKELQPRTSDAQGAAFFVPFAAPRKDTAVQVPEDPAVLKEVTPTEQKHEEVQRPDVSTDPLVHPEASPPEAPEESMQPESSPPQPAFLVKGSRSAELKGNVAAPEQSEGTKPHPDVAGVPAPAVKQYSVEAGSGPLPSKTAGPPRPRSSQETSRKPLSPHRLGDVPFPKSPAGPYSNAMPPRAPVQMIAGSSSPPPARWPELPRPPAFLPDSFPLCPPGAAETNGFAGMPPSWQSNAGWRGRDQNEEDLMLQRAYEVYRQQQLELLRQ